MRGISKTEVPSCMTQMHLLRLLGRESSLRRHGAVADSDPSDTNNLCADVNSETVIFDLEYSDVEPDWWSKMEGESTHQRVGETTDSMCRQGPPS